MPAFSSLSRRAALAGTCALLTLAPLPGTAQDLSPKGTRMLLAQIAAERGGSLGRAARTADLDLTPAPGALQKLSGAVPEIVGRIAANLQGEQAFMAASVLGALGRAVGDDHLESEIEFRPAGQVLVNGAPAPF